MKEVVEVVKRSFAPLVMGWILTVWVPVPAPVKDALSTTVAAVINGFRAAAGTTPAHAQNASKPGPDRIQ